MNEKRGNIETWLKAAAQRPGPGSDQRDEDAGWDGLSAMLDEKEDDNPGVIGWILQGKRWMALGVIALVIPVVLFIFLRRSNDISLPVSGETQANVTTDKINTTGGDSTFAKVPAQPFDGPAAPAAKGVVTGNAVERNAAATIGSVSTSSAVRNFTTKTSATNNAAASNADHPAPVQLQANEAKQQLVQLQPTISSAQINDLLLQTLPLIRIGNDGLTLSGVHAFTIRPLQDSSVAHYSRWALQAGFITANDKGLGGRLSFMYRLPVGRSFYLQPYIGAGYTGNYDKRLQHLGVISKQYGNSGQYRTDSTWTIYQVKNVISADAGIRIGYSLRQFSFATGIRYQNIPYSGGDSLFFQKPAPAPASGVYGHAFSTADAPGKHSFYWEAEAAYQWRSGLQAGISYQLLIHENTSPAWQLNVPNISGGSGSSVVGYTYAPAKNKSLQDKSRLEIYLRIPLRKKIK